MNFDFIIKIGARLRSIPPWRTVVVSLILIVTVAGVDNYATPSMSFTLFYVLIVMFAAWAGGRRVGIAIAIASTTALTLDELLLGQKHAHPILVLGWNCGVRFGIFFIVAVLSAAVKQFTDALGKRVDQRTVELEKTNVELAAQTSILKSICNSVGEGIVVADNDGKFILFTPLAEEILGIGSVDVKKDEWTKLYGVFYPDRITPFPNENLPVLRALRGESSDNVEMFIRNQQKPKGVFVSITGRPLLGESGQQLGGVVILRDITDERLATNRLSVQHAVTKILAEVEAMPDAASKILQAICELLDWELGILWKIEPETKLFSCVQMWHRPHMDIEDFKKWSLKTSYAPRTAGLLGRVLSNGKPAWIPDVTQDPNFCRAPLAAEVGLHCGFAFPILIGGKVHSLVEFFSKEIRDPDEKLLQLFAILGIQIGQFIVRKETEEANKAQARVLENMVEGITLVDELGIICITNPALDGMFGYARGELIGKHISLLNDYPPNQNSLVVENVFKEAISHGTWSGEFQNRRKDGTQFVSEARISVLEISGKRYLISVQQDVTERKRLEKEILEISDREQGRIGQDLHDGLCQHLVSTAFLSNALEKNLNDRSAPEAEAAGKVATLLDTAITQARNIARGLYPVNLEADGLISALQELSENIATSFDIRCELICTGTVLIEDNTIATHLYRIAQEAANNAVKHGRADQILIELSQTADKIMLKISDDGVGISQLYGFTGGMGMHIMDYRSRIIGGNLDVKSSDDIGTTIVCIVPRKIS